jgi:hypothetical protein
MIGEIDVVGAQKRLVVVQQGAPVVTASGTVTTPERKPLPRSVAPPGTRLLARLRIHNWVIARFALSVPRSLTIDQLSAIAPTFFRHTPAALLIFTQNVSKTST